MNHLTRLIVVLAAISILAGCSGYKTAYLPGDKRVLAEVESARPVEVGAKVRVSLRAGGRVEGVVSEIGAGYLEVVGLAPVVSAVQIQATQVSKVEVYVQKSAGADLGAAALVVGGLVGGYYLVNSGDTGGVEWQVTK